MNDATCSILQCWELLVNNVVSVCTQVRLRVNGSNIVGQRLPTLLDVTCCVRLLNPVACCWVLLRKVWNRSNFFSQQLPTFLLFRDRRSVAQSCWIRLHSSSNIVGATYAQYTWFEKAYGLFLSHDALQVPKLLGVVASVCTLLPTRTQQLPTLLAQQCWELLRPFACTLRFWQLQCIHLSSRTFKFILFFNNLLCLSVDWFF